MRKTINQNNDEIDSDQETKNIPSNNESPKKKKIIRRASQVIPNEKKI